MDRRVYYQQRQHQGCFDTAVTYYILVIACSILCLSTGSLLLLHLQPSPYSISSLLADAATLPSAEASGSQKETASTPFDDDNDNTIKHRHQTTRSLRERTGADRRGAKLNAQLLGFSGSQHRHQSSRPGFRTRRDSTVNRRRRPSVFNVTKV